MHLPFAPTDHSSPPPQYFLGPGNSGSSLSLGQLFSFHLEVGTCGFVFLCRQQNASQFYPCYYKWQIFVLLCPNMY